MSTLGCGYMAESATKVKYDEEIIFEKYFK